MQRMGLYYPYIHFRSEKWLKLAALYWPRIARVVPQDYATRDSHTARVLADKRFVINVAPGSSATAVASIFIEAIEREASQLRRTLGVFTADTPIRPDNAHVPDRAATSWAGHAAGAYGPPPLRPPKRLAGVYHAEVAPSLREALIESGLALETSREVRAGTASRESGHWLAMDPRLAWAYKCALTDDLARANQLEPLTDGIAAYALTRPWTADYVLELLSDQFAPDGPSTARPLEDVTAGGDTATRVAMLAMQLVVPQDLDGVRAEQIVAIRTRCGAEFDAFRDAVTAAADELADLSTETADPAIMAAYLDQIVTRQFKRPLANLRSAMHGLNVDTALTAASAKFELPAAVATLAGGAMAGQPAVATAGGLAFTLFGLGRSWKQGLAARRGTSPESYLLRVDKGLKPRSLLTRVRNPRRHDARTT